MVYISDFFKGNPIADKGFISNTAQPGSLISAILPNAYIIAAFILFIYLIVGGFMFISAGSNEKQAETGKQALTNAIIGFVIIFVSYWIIQIIQIITGVSILN